MKQLFKQGTPSIGDSTYSPSQRGLSSVQNPTVIVKMELFSINRRPFQLQFWFSENHHRLQSSQLPDMGGGGKQGKFLPFVLETFSCLLFDSSLLFFLSSQSRIKAKHGNPFQMVKKSH